MTESRKLPRGSWDGPLTEDADLCFYHSERGIVEIEGTVAEPGFPVRDAAELALVFTEPCFVRTGNRTFCVEEEGFYRFAVMPNTIRHRILFRGNIPRLVGAIGHLHIHGWRDNALPVAELLAKAESVLVSITCGVIREVGRELMSGLGIETRRISTFTLDRWNSYNCGHALFEYRDPVQKRWILADSDLGVMFRAEGSWLDTDTVCRHVRNGTTWELAPVTSGMSLDLCAHGVDATTSFWALAMASFSDPAQVRRFFERVFQVPQIGDDYTVDTEAQRRRFDAVCATQKLRYTYLSPRDFRAKFYG